MKKIPLFILVAITVLAGCKKNSAADTPTPNNVSLEGAVVIRNGVFEFSKASTGTGIVKVYQRPDGRHVLGLEQMMVTGSSDLEIYLSASPGFEGKMIKLFSIRSINGKYYYEIPAGINLADFNYVLIITDTANEPLASAPLH